MLHSRWSVALLALVGLGAPAFGQDTVNLNWKFEAGKTFYQTMTTTTDQNMTVMGMKVNQKQSQTFYFSWTPQKQDDKKNWIIQQKIIGVKMNIDIGGNPIAFDSTKDTNTNNPLSDFFKAIVGSEFTLTVSPEYKVTAVQGKKEFLDKLIGANQQMKPLLEQILSDDAIKQMAEQAFAVVPGKPVKKGDTWTKGPIKLDLGPIGTYETNYTYTYEGKDETQKNLDKIKVDTALKYTPPSDTATNSTLPFKIKSATLTSSNASGTILFDNDKGRVASSTMPLKLDGKLSIDISGMSTDVDMSQTQETKVETSDKSPLEAPMAAPKSGT